MSITTKIKNGEISVKDLVKDKKAIFKNFHDDMIWYETEDGFEFPISVEDAKGGRFTAEHKAMELMRWVRKHFELIKSGDGTV